MVKVIFNSLLLLFLISCSSNEGGTTIKRNSFLPDAQYNGDYVWLISDTSTWKGAFGKAIQADYSNPYSVFPQDEKSYRVTFSEYIGLNDLMKRWEVMIFAVDLNKDTRLKQYVLRKFQSKLKDHDIEYESFMLKDQWANGQLVVYLIGASEQALLRGYKKQEQAIREMVDAHVMTRAVKSVNKLTKNKISIKEVDSAYSFNIQIPAEYTSAGNLEKALWYLKDIPTGYQAIVFYSTSYEDSSDFNSEQIIQERDKYLSFVQGESDEEAMVTERRVVIEDKVISIGNQYCKELRGLWRLKGAFTGGPFVHYAVYNPNTKMINHVDVFVMAPGDKKKPLIRELEAIVQTIKF